MSSVLIFSILCLKFWTSVHGNIHESGEHVFQNALRWNYTYMNPTCTDATGGRNPCQDVRVCRFATASLALGGWPTLCGWVGKGVPKVCCGLPLVLGPGLIKKVDEEISRKRECGTRIHSVGLSETTNAFIKILNSLPDVDISDPNKFDPPLDLKVEPILVPPVSYTGSRQGDFPWMVSIRNNGTHVCGGSLIDRKHILTAARCVFGNIEHFSVHVGNLYVDDGYVIPVAKIAIHPKYQMGVFKNLAILTLSEEILSPLVPHICLDGSDSAADDLRGINATLLRWGKNALNSTNRQKLRIIDGLTVVPMEECQEIYSADLLAGGFEDFVCTERNKGDKKSCEEDYGGPLMHNGNYGNHMDHTAPWTAIGVDTFGSICESKKRLKLYTKVSSNLDWILETMEE